MSIITLESILRDKVVSVLNPNNRSRRFFSTYWTVYIEPSFYPVAAMLGHVKEYSINVSETNLEAFICRGALVYAVNSKSGGLAKIQFEPEWSDPVSEYLANNPIFPKIEDDSFYFDGVTYNFDYSIDNKHYYEFKVRFQPSTDALKGLEKSFYQIAAKIPGHQGWG